LLEEAMKHGYLSEQALAFLAVSEMLLHLRLFSGLELMSRIGIEQLLNVFVIVRTAG
jgi:hypothetical protein